MEDLNFPVFDQPLPSPPSVPLEQSLGFIEMCFKCFFNRETHEYWRKQRLVTTPFRLK